MKLCSYKVLAALAPGLILLARLGFQLALAAQGMISDRRDVAKHLFSFMQLCFVVLIINWICNNLTFWRRI